jgi:hypothetical protein
LDSEGWLRFLRDEYFRWKYIAPNRYVTTTQAVERWVQREPLQVLHAIKEQLLAVDQAGIHATLKVALQIPGLGTAGASGLLALLYPASFGTVGQFVVKALREVLSLRQAGALLAMNPERLTVKDVVVLVTLMREQAAGLTRAFRTQAWTPRMVDKALWTYGGRKGRRRTEV